MKRIILFILLLASCADSSRVLEMQYYENTKKIKSKKVYQTFKDNEAGNFIQFKYFENGVLSEKIEYQANLIHGSVKEFDTNGILRFEGFFENGVENGIFRWYNNKQMLVSESLIINGKEILLKNFVAYLPDSIYGYEIYKMRNDTMIEREGHIKLNEKMQAVDSLSFYFRTDMPDSVHTTDTFNFQVELLLNNNIYMSNKVLLLGELQGDFILKDTIASFTAKKENNIIHGKYLFERRGYQVLTGLIDIEIPNPDNPTEKLYANFIFYHQIFVE